MITPFGRICMSMGGNSECWGKLSRKKEADIRQQEVFNMFFNYLGQRALSRYDIENVPDTCDAMVIKQSLLWTCCCGFIDLDGVLVSLPSYPGTDPTMYGYRKAGYAYSYDGTPYDLALYIPGMPDYIPNASHGIYRASLVYENYNFIPFSLFLFEMAEACADTWRKMEVARTNAAVPYVIGTDENSVNSVKKTLEQRDSNMSAIVVNFGFSVAKGSFFPIQDAMKGMNAFEQHLQYLLNYYDTICGIPNNPVVRKKERVNSSEIEASEFSTTVSLDDTIEALEYYFGEVNRVFGTNMKAVRKEAQENDDGGIPDVGAEAGSSSAVGDA